MADLNRDESQGDELMQEELEEEKTAAEYSIPGLQEAVITFVQGLPVLCDFREKNSNDRFVPCARIHQSAR